MAYTTQKLSRNRVAIFQDGVELCQLRPEEVRGWLFVRERSDAQDAAYEIEARARRVANAREYLAARALRPVQLTLQLTFDL